LRGQEEKCQLIIQILSGAEREARRELADEPLCRKNSGQRGRIYATRFKKGKTPLEKHMGRAGIVQRKKLIVDPGKKIKVIRWGRRLSPTCTRGGGGGMVHGGRKTPFGGSFQERNPGES